MRWLLLAVLALSGCGHSMGQQGKPDHIGGKKTLDVESVLKSGRWEKRAGLGSGMSWRYLDGGKVLIYDGTEINESYRWEVISRDEAMRTIKIRYWTPADSQHEYRVFIFRFSADGSSAEVDNWLHKNGQQEFRSTSTQYRIP